MLNDLRSLVNAVLLLSIVSMNLVPVVGTVQNKSAAVPLHGTGSKKYLGTGTVLGKVLFLEVI